MIARLSPLDLADSYQAARYRTRIEYAMKSSKLLLDAALGIVSHTEVGIALHAEVAVGDNAKVGIALYMPRSASHYLGIALYVVADPMHPASTLRDILPLHPVIYACDLCTHRPALDRDACSPPSGLSKEIGVRA